ncbi:MAG: lytic murein transglycosylase [Proteobacteria bacterium]|nr:lytic murein transglycosylase [Pseudomonadota bacterium]
MTTPLRPLQHIAAAVAAALLTLPGSAPALAQDRQPFDAWLADLRVEAEAAGIRAEILDASLTGLVPIEQVVQLDRNQPEYTLTVERYLSRVAPQSRVDRGRRMLSEHSELLARISTQYGVQARFIVAFWAIESDFGRNTGGFSVVQALATLAWDPRRSSFFRAELLAALRILNEGHIAPGDMKGSWAGAMGQTQFLPSVFLRSAVDFDGDGRKDVWGTTADALASAANHLRNIGWIGDQTWGRAVLLPADFDRARASLDISLPISDWQAAGVRRADGADLPTRQLQASIVLPEEGALSPAYLVYNNYRSILRWNRSTLFALGVGSLADQIGGG